MKSVWFALLALCLHGCSGVFFYPQQKLLRTPADLKLAYSDVYLRSADQTLLHAWHLPARGPADATLLFLHGNAENISTHLGNIHWLPAEGYNVFMLDYRGYGQSEGRPDIAGVQQDIHAALDYVLTHSQVPVAVLGQSLGGSLSLGALADYPRRAELCTLVVDSAFADYRQIAREKLAAAWLTWALQWPLSLAVDNRYRPQDAVARLAPLPLLLLHGENDEVVPPHHARQLFAAAGEPKTLWLLPDTRHIQALQNPAVRRRLLDYLAERTKACP